ncbi:MAG: outer membrane beta-barrel protein [Flavobacteriia bacterium]|nr:outer membrane beta-barrel protein [Flavobacteriia bacterium]
MFKKQVTILFFLFTFSFFSQELEISGHVVDTTNTSKRALPNALAMLVRIKDSLLIDFKRTDNQGDFTFKLSKLDTFELRISHPQFSDYSYYIFPSVSNRQFSIKQIILPPKSQLLKEVVIFAYKDPIFYKGDTLVYVADSFATKPNAVVEDLLKKLPGIKVSSDGTIQAQGKEVQQVLVDGDEFFGADPTMATKNLPANSIENVQIYEKKDENSTENETIQVLDLKLKEDAKKGYFGKISFASDVGATSSYPPFYEGEALFNRFDKKQKIAVFSLLSNTIKSSLNWSDMYTYGLNQERDWQNDEDDFMWFNSDSQNGIPKTWKSGVFYNNKINKKLEANVNYTYNNNELFTNDKEKSQFLLNDSTYTSDVENQSVEKVQSHEINMKYKWKIDSLNSLVIEPKWSLKTNKTNNESLNKFNNSFGSEFRNTTTANENIAEGVNSSIQMSYRKNFKKKNRSLLTKYSLVSESNQSEANLVIQDTEEAFNFDQNKKNNAKSLSHNAKLNYIEPIGKKFKIETEYEFYIHENSQEKYTYNLSNQTYTELDSNFSNDFVTNKNFHRIGTQIIFEHKKHRLTTGVYFRQVDIDNKNLFFNTEIHQLINNVLPRFRYVYKFSQNSRLNFNYRTSSSQPTINQLQPVPDNSNPNRIQIGNPNLNPNFVHKLSVNYNTYKALSNTYLWASMNYTSTQNAISKSSFYDSYGRNVSQAINVNGNYTFDANFSFGFPVFNSFLDINPDIAFANSRVYNYINSQENKTINSELSGGVNLNTSEDSLEFSIGAYLVYNIPFSSITSQELLPYYTQNYSARIHWTTPFGLFIETDAQFTINSQRSDGYNINYFIWNLNVGKSFLKNKNLIISVDTYDLLNQNISANREVSANVITDSKSLVIARYFLLRLSYKFNHKKSKEEDEF